MASSKSRNDCSILATRAAPQRGILLMRRSAACNSVSVSELPSRIWINLPRLHAASRSGVIAVSGVRDYEFFSAGKMPADPTAKIAVLLIQPALGILLVV